MASWISTQLRQTVADRAKQLCEYCFIAEADTFYGCEVDHIISLKHGGSSDPDNLAYACAPCNRAKGSDVASISASSQRFACGFLQIPPRDGHPCRSANDSPCRVRRRLSLPSKTALPGARTKKASLNGWLFLPYVLLCLFVANKTSSFSPSLRCCAGTPAASCFFLAQEQKRSPGSTAYVTAS